MIEFRTSADGVNWETLSPSFLNGADYWEPDALDHPDTEFYRVSTFPYQGRYATLLLDYKADPNTPGEHSQVRYKTEWAISHDGLNWERPVSRHQRGTKHGLDAGPGTDVHGSRPAAESPMGFCQPA